MDPTIEYLWAAGYDLPPKDQFWRGGQPIAADTPQEPAATPDLPRRGKKAARAKRQKAVS